MNCICVILWDIWEHTYGPKQSSSFCRRCPSSGHVAAACLPLKSNGMYTRSCIYHTVARGLYASCSLSGSLRYRGNTQCKPLRRRHTRCKTHCLSDVSKQLITLMATDSTSGIDALIIVFVQTIDAEIVVTGSSNSAWNMQK